MSDEPVHILLVEDNPGDIYLFRKALEAADLRFRLTVLEDGADALSFIRGEGKYARSPAPDLIVLDLNLPKYDGSHVLRAIRQAGRFSHVPAVIASSLPSLPTGPDQQSGITRYIRKPSDLDEFLNLGATLKEVLLETRRAGAS